MVGAKSEELCREPIWSLPFVMKRYVCKYTGVLFRKGRVHPQDFCSCFSSHEVISINLNRFVWVRHSALIWALIPLAHTTITTLFSICMSPYGGCVCVWERGSFSVWRLLVIPVDCFNQSIMYIFFVSLCRVSKVGGRLGIHYWIVKEFLHRIWFIFFFPMLSILSPAEKVKVNIS